MRYLVDVTCARGERQQFLLEAPGEDAVRRYVARLPGENAVAAVTTVDDRANRFAQMSASCLRCGACGIVMVSLVAAGHSREALEQNMQLAYRKYLSRGDMCPTATLSETCNIVYSDVDVSDKDISPFRIDAAGEHVPI